MTTITIERKLLEQALTLLSAPNHRIFSEPNICLNLRAALAAPATAPAQPAPERKPMTVDEARIALGLEKPPPLCVMLDVRAVEAFHGIKEDKP